MAGSILLEERVITCRYALALMSFHRGPVAGWERGNLMRTLAAGRRSRFSPIDKGLHGCYMYRLTKSAAFITANLAILGLFCVLVGTLRGSWWRSTGWPFKLHANEWKMQSAHCWRDMSHYVNAGLFSVSCDRDDFRPSFKMLGRALQILHILGLLMSNRGWILPA